MSETCRSLRQLSRALAVKTDRWRVMRQRELSCRMQLCVRVSVARALRWLKLPEDEDGAALKS